MILEFGQATVAFLAAHACEQVGKLKLVAVVGQVDRLSGLDHRR